MLPDTSPVPVFTAPQTQAIQRAHAFLRGFDECCGWIFPPQGEEAPAFTAVRERLKQHARAFGPDLLDERLDAWKAEWFQVAYDACVTIGDWLDTHPGASPTAENYFPTLLQWLGMAQIRPALNTPLSIWEHNLVGTLPVTGPDCRPGEIAGVRARGYRNSKQVLRKADIHIFDQAVLLPVAPPPATQTNSLLTPLLICIVLFLAFLLWWIYRKPAAKPVPTAVFVTAPSEPSLRPNPGAARRSDPTPSTAPTAGPQVSITRFTVQPAQVRFGQSITVSWEVSFASSVRITPWPGSTTPSGSTQFVPTADTTEIVLEAKGLGDGNVVSARRAIQVLPANPGAAPNPAQVSRLQFRGDRSQITYGESVTLAWSAPGASAIRLDPEPPGFDPSQSSGQVTASPTRNTEYTLTAGNSVRRFLVRVLPRIATFEAVPSTIQQCKVVVLRWKVEGASAISIEPGVGVVRTPYQIVRPRETTRYVLRADGEGGSSTSELTVAVTPGQTWICGPM